MRTRVLILVAILMGSLQGFGQAPNTLTKQEKKDGWKLLWDGKTTKGWTGRMGGPFPTVGWEIKDGELRVTETNTKEGGDGGDIISDRKYADYELSVDFKITPGANSGILYLVDLSLKPGPQSPVGYEYQILDDDRHPDAKRGKDGDRTVASLYDMMPAAKGKPIHPVGEWNTAKIVVRGTHGEHWLNGVKVLEYDRASPEFKQIVSEDKFKVYPNFDQMHDTPIVLQDHGFPVAFRNIKIREIK